MNAFSLAFDSPGYLALLALIPLLWWWGYRSLAGLGRWRRLAALGLRSLVVTAIVLALADVQYQRKNDELTVVYLLDQSLSIPPEQRQAMMGFVKGSIEEHRDAARGDRYAVIVFGRDAEVEIPLVKSDLALHARVESLLDPEYTDVGKAIQRAKAILPHDAACRIVLVTDGNQNLGSAYREARTVSDAGVSLDVVPVYLEKRTEVAVEKVDVPAMVRKDQPFQLRVVLKNDAPESSSATVRGTLRIVCKTGDNEETVAEQEVTIPPGKRVFSIPEEIHQADFYTYEARFSPAGASSDGMAQNNTASAFTHIRGRGQVLLIENFDSPGEFDVLVERLRAEGLEVTVRSTGELFNSLPELQRYDCVVLGNVSRSSGDDADSVANFSDAQIEMLVQNTSELGCGLVMLGGPETFGAGGWSNTKLEEAMPVDFQIKSAKVTPVGALALVIDRSGSMDGDKLRMSRAAAIAAVRALGARDFVSVTAFDEAPYKIVPLRRVGNFRGVAARIERITCGGGTNLYPAMAEAFQQLRKSEAGVKHMIVLTDGQTPDAEFGRLVRRMRAARITLSAVAVGVDANVPLLQGMAAAGAGKFYLVKNPAALPRIFMREVRRVARPLVFEPPDPVAPQVVSSHEILSGLGDALPPIRGFVLTEVKQNPLVQVLLRSPTPVDEKNATILAAWNYGAGKTVALTTDAGKRWATSWSEWEGYDKLFSQIVRWAMRPSGDTGNYSVATSVKDGRTEIVVTAMDESGELLNNEAMTASVIAPNHGTEGGATLPVAIEQTAPGRYVGSFPSEEAGSYMVVVTPGPGKAPIITGVSVGYSAEYKASETNVPLLKSLAQLEPGGDGPRGVFVEEGLARAAAQTAAAAIPAATPLDPFRADLPPAVSNQPIWPWVVVAGTVLFWSDVFVRRVQVNLAWLAPLWTRVVDKVLRRERAVPVPETMSRLRSRKEQIAMELLTRREGNFIEPAATGQDWQRELSTSVAPVGSVSPATPATEFPPSPDVVGPSDESYTARLLKAKKRIWE